MITKTVWKTKRSLEYTTLQLKLEIDLYAGGS